MVLSNLFACCIINFGNIVTENANLLNLQIQNCPPYILEISANLLKFVQAGASELVEISTAITFFKSKLDFTSWIKQVWFNLKVQFPWMNFPLYFIVFQDVNKKYSNRKELCLKTQ